MLASFNSIAELEALLAKPNLTVVDFTATWCGPCRMIGPIFERFSGQYTDVTFVKLDIDDPAYTSFVQKHNVTSLPTFIFFKNGQAVARFSGADAGTLKRHIEANM
ncbi:hypothetical protein H696_04546 [Fonticula alba]|uniref:Thioredoxin n=1 Tax=Fonticula alba TaxID=691883 RepID=A0A058Z4S5_FONAL|nr:hypothetical protein H696_04546 [Fonticula alba]KCV69131.1 hypothetical protein H696_04546 [Fonticula alba]|eukprot:XP_009496702.1 hypothetical protein H696_04546 [Fonticula alba]